MWFRVIFKAISSFLQPDMRNQVQIVASFLNARGWSYKLMSVFFLRRPFLGLSQDATFPSCHDSLCEKSFPSSFTQFCYLNYCPNKAANTYILLPPRYFLKLCPSHSLFNKK